MKNLRKYITLLILSLVLWSGVFESNFENDSIVFSASSSGQWIKSSNGKWWYKYSDGSYAIGWKKINNKWYHFNSDGWMSVGWLKDIDGKWYYLENSGSMRIGWLELGEGIWYFFNSSGAMQTGYNRISNKDYYFSSSGKLKYSGDLLVTVLGKDYSILNKEDRLDTNPDVDNIKDIFKNTNYIVNGIKNSLGKDLFEVNSYINKKNINSGIFIFSGHGSRYSYLFFNNDSIVTSKDILKENLNNTNIAFFFNCFGATNKYSKSIVDSAVEAGAKSAYGYTKESYLLEDRKLQRDILTSLLEGNTLDESVRSAKSLNSSFIVVKDNRIVIKGNKNIKLPSYKIRKNFRENIYDVLSDRQLKEFVIESGIGVRYYKDIYTTDSFSLDSNNNIINSKLDLIDKDLSFLDEIIINKKKGEIYDINVQNLINNDEKISYKLSFITSINSVPKLIRSYYISDKNNQSIVKKFCIDVETGKFLSDKEIQNLY